MLMMGHGTIHALLPARKLVILELFAFVLTLMAYCDAHCDSNVLVFHSEIFPIYMMSFKTYRLVSDIFT
jgi:hypothetical protein